MTKSAKRDALLRGTLDMLILKAISLGPLHGYGILLRIQQISKDRLEIQQGSLYPALYRLERQGSIASVWGSGTAEAGTIHGPNGAKVSWHLPWNQSNLNG